MSILFAQSDINGLVLRNRFCRSATWEGMAADDGGVTPGLIETMRALAEGGVGLIISSHAYVSPEGKAGPWQIGVYKEELDIPLILVGGIRSFEVAERMVEDGVADYISMSRPFIREPDLINRWKAGDRSIAKCKSDNLCFKTGLEGNGIYCATKQKEHPH